MTTQTSINLKPFCAKPGGRYSLDAPFVIGGWLYATDGAVIVRIPATSEPDVGLERKVPRKLEAYLPTVADDATWHAFPKVKECLPCAGHGFIDVPCPTCGQDTKKMCECKATAIRLGPAEVAEYYASLIASLPGVQYVKPATANDIVRFRFDGGEGSVMPLQPSG